MSNDRNIKTYNNMKLKTEINHYRWLLTVLLLVAAMVVPSVAWAEESTVSFTAKEGTAGFSESESYDKLIDGKYTSDGGTKWCMSFPLEGAYIIFSASEPIWVTGYSIVTGDDNADYAGKNPRSWKLFGCNDASAGRGSESWVLIDQKYIDRLLKDENYQKCDYTSLSNPPSEKYQYFKMEITATKGARIMQMSELILTYSTCNHQWTKTREVSPTCTKGGYDVYQCSVCNSTKNVPNGTLALGHQWGTDDVCDVCNAPNTEPYKPAGEGTAESPYQIETVEELYWFAALVNGDTNIDGVEAPNTAACAKLTENITVNTGVLDANGNLVNNGTSFRSWTPIGYTDNAYTGIFDGNGKTISGLYFNSATDNVGLFGYISNGTIKNVGVVDSYLWGRIYVGGVCGYNDQGTMENCYNKGTVSGAGDHVGGVCGDNRGTISNCYNTGAVRGDKKGSGGVCGSNSGTITNCYNIGAVSGNGNNCSVGGVCGVNFGTIANCYSTGTVSRNGNNCSVGGVCGDNLNGGTIKNCYYDFDKFVGAGVNNTGGKSEKVEDKTTEQFKNGEVAYLLSQGCTIGGTTYEGSTWGQNLGDGGYEYPVFNSDKKVFRGYVGCKLTFSNNENELSQTQDAHGFNNEGFCSVCNAYQPATMNGGVYEIRNAGQLYWFAALVNGDTSQPNITEKDLTASAKLMNDITVNQNVLDESGELISGSFISWRPIGSDFKHFEGTFDGNNHTISGLYYSSTIKCEVGLFGCVANGGVIKNVGVVDSYFKGIYRIGGLCGFVALNGTISNCYNASTVIGELGSASVKLYVGGICGQNNGTITNCYSRGKVDGPSNDNSHVGGLCGFNNNKYITNCYYDSNIYTGSAVGKNLGTGTANVEGKTTAQFKSGEVAWLLNGSTSENPTWHQNIGSGTLDDYPVLDNTHQVVYACTLSEPTHGSLGVTDENNVVLTPTNDKKIFGAKGFKVIITATPEENTNVKYKLKLLKANEDEISTGVGIEIDKDITITAEFALDWFVVDGVKYKVIEFSDKVKVIGHDDPSNELTISKTVTYTSDNQPRQFTVTEIADDVYKDKTNLTKVIFPSTLESIGASAFSGCSSLATITFNGATPTIGENAFSGVNENVVINVPGLYGESYINAFSENLINKIKTDKALITLFPGSCGKIKVYVVDEDGSSTEQDIIDNNKVVVDWDKTVKIEAVANSGYGVSWLKIDGEQQRGNSYTTPAPLAGGYVEDGEIVGNIKAEASFYYIIPSVFMYDDVCYEKRWDANYWEEVTVRNLNYFYYDKHYTGDLELPEKVEYYGSYYKVTAISERAFSGSSELRSVVLPSVMNKIGSYAFEGCTGLEKLVVKSPSAATRAATTEPTVPTVDEHAFDDICETAVLYVPENWKEAFKASPEWRKFFAVKEQREDGTVLAELTMTSTYGGKLAVGEIVSESDTRIVKVAEGSSVTVEVTPREGYMLTNLSYDGTDVMEQLVDGKLTLTGISGEKYITAVFGIDTGIGNSGASSQKVYVKDGRIVVDGVTAGEEIFIYNAAGQLLRSEVANGERLEIPMTAGQVYIVKIGKKIVKI